jgi:hypothetical protein
MQHVAGPAGPAGSAGDSGLAAPIGGDSGQSGMGGGMPMMGGMGGGGGTGGGDHERGASQWRVQGQLFDDVSPGGDPAVPLTGSLDDTSQPQG